MEHGVCNQQSRSRFVSWGPARGYDSVTVCFSSEWLMKCRCIVGVSCAPIYSPNMKVFWVLKGVTVQEMNCAWGCSYRFGFVLVGPGACCDLAGAWDVIVDACSSLIR